LAVARALGKDGYGITLSARKPDKLEVAAEELRGEGIDVEAAQANMAHEEDIKRAAQAHRDRWGRLDVLMNNAGIGIGGLIADAETKKVDIQLDVNLRAVYLMTREAIPLLKEAGSEHGKALVVNTATKFGVVGLSQAMHKELAQDGVQVTALCPGFVATAMTDWVEGEVPKDQMIQPADIAEAVRYLLRTSPNCIVPEIQFIRPGDNV
jgi:NAD(P)-dependent dehydrogenase (short-subunit alcohol dehydrogenase family)